MIYCREKLIDVILEYPWIDIDEWLDAKIGIELLIKQGSLSVDQWRSTKAYLEQHGGIGKRKECMWLDEDVTPLTRNIPLTPQIESVLNLLADALGYTDESAVKQLPEHGSVTMAKVKALKDQ